MQLGKHHLCSNRPQSKQMGWENMEVLLWRLLWWQSHLWNGLHLPAGHNYRGCGHGIRQRASHPLPRSCWEPAPRAATGGSGFLKMHPWCCSWSWPHFPPSKLCTGRNCGKKIHQESMNVIPQVKLHPTCNPTQQMLMPCPCIRIAIRAIFPRQWPPLPW